MATTTVRIDEQTHRALQQLSCELSEPMQSVLTRAVEAFRRRHFLDAANAEYARLRADPEAWAEEMAERKLWDMALMDDLDDEVNQQDAN